MATIDLAIIGGGLCGAAIGYECAKLGIAVLLLERATLGGGGATRHSRGIARLYDPNPALMRWAGEGVDCWRNWQLPGPAPFTSCGVVTLLSDQNVDMARRAVQEYHRDNYRLILLRHSSLVDRYPWLKMTDEGCGDRFAIFEPDGGYCDPRLATALYGHAIRQLGGTVLEDATVTKLQWSSSRVEMTVGRRCVEAKLAVLAAGADAPKFMARLPISARPIWLSCFKGETRVPNCCVLDETTGAYLRPEPARHFYCGGADDVGGGMDDDPIALMDVVHQEHERKCRDLLHDAPSRALYGMRGADGYTSDHLPLLGFRDDHPTICLAAGFSGRGAKYIPAVAKRLSGEIRDRL
jgi:glycine/D-amino acid oxidase-like deaminating enzyme